MPVLPRSRPTLEEVEDVEHFRLDEEEELEDWEGELEDWEGELTPEKEYADIQEGDKEWEDEDGDALPASSDAYNFSSPRQSLSPDLRSSSIPPSSPTPASKVASTSRTATTVPLHSVSTPLAPTFPHPTVTRAPTTPHTPRSKQARWEQLLAEEGIAYTSPARGETPHSRAAHRQARLRRKQSQRMALTHQAKLVIRARSLRSRCLTVLGLAKRLEVRFGDLMNFVFDPKEKQGNVRWKGFFNRRGSATQILNWWASSKSAAVRQEVTEWAIDRVVRLVAKEARKVTEGGELQGKKHVVDQDFVSSFDLSNYTDRLFNEWAPVAMRVLSAFSTSRHVKTHSKKRRMKTALVQTTIALMALGEYSRDNNLIKRLLTLYLYSCGAQRQLIHVVSKLGVAESYSAMLSTRLRKKRRTKKKDSSATPVQASNTSVDTPEAPPTSSAPLSTAVPEEGVRLGSLYQLSDSVRREARRIAATGLFGVVYDNINFNFANAEQIIGRHDTQENGTCATLFTLNGPASLRDLDARRLQQSFLNAPPLSLDDIRLDDQENSDLTGNLVATILRIIIEFGGDRFQVFKKDMDEFQPSTAFKVDPTWKTKLYPLPAWNIDESSITGNIEVNNAIVEELELDKHPDFEKRARILAGDQLTIARLRSIEGMRAGCEVGYEGFFWGIHILGLFHTKIADIHGLLLTHMGKSNSGTSNPGSLSFHNTCLDRLPITPTSLPPFRVCRDLVFVSLYARVLHCLLLVSGCSTLDDYMEKYGTWKDLVYHAQTIWDKYARGEVVEDMRFERQMQQLAGDDVTKGDMVFENAVLFMRDALISREFTDAIRSNDPGRIILVLKLFALSFRGTGRVKYAYEMLFFIHHIKHIWTPGARRIVFNNMVLNPSGEPESGVECDLVQEHMNLLAKAKYKARGSNASWEWMYIITPCTNALRDLQSQINSNLGSDLGKKHANAQLEADIQCLMDSLQDHQVYVPVPGRMTNEDDPEVPDVINVGLSQLCSLAPNSPLVEYNAAFKRLQKRRKMTPVTKSPSPTLTFTALPDSLGGSIFPSTPSPPSSSPPASPSMAPSPSPPSPLSTSSPTIGELAAEIGEAREDVEAVEPLLEGELRQMMDDLDHGVVDETLRRESLRDVALDMDAIGSDDETESEGSGVESDDDYVE